MGSFTKDLLRYLPGEAGLAILALVSVPILTRVLSVEQFGNYALVMSSVVITVRLFGSFPMGIVRFYPAVPEKERDVLVRTSVWGQVAAVLASAVIFLILIWVLWSNDSFVRSLAIAGVAIAATQSVFQLLVEVLRAGHRVELYNLYRIWNKIAGLACGVGAAILLDFGVLGILWGAVIGFLTTLPFLWKSVFSGFGAIGRVSKAMAREVGGFGLPLVVGNLGAWVLSQFDRYFIQHYFGAREVGLYSAAYTISEHSITMLAMFFMVSSTPLLTSEWENRGQQASQAMFVSVTRSYVLLAIPAVVGLSVLAEPLMTLLAGAEFASGYSIVPWVVTGAFFLGLQHRFNQVLRLLKRTGDIMFWILVAAAVNVVLNWWLIPSFGYKIAAVNTFICYVLLCLGQAWTSRRHFRWPFPWLTTLRSGLAASVMFAALLLLKSTLSLSPICMLSIAIPGGMMIYGIAIWALGEVSLTELRALRGAGVQKANRHQRNDTFGKRAVASSKAVEAQNNKRSVA